MSDLSQERLEASAGAWAPEVRFCPECDSTNRVAAEWAAEGAPEGCLVVTDHQVAGRGRMGRGWFAPPGGSLLVSVILRPRLPASQLGLVSITAGVAAARAIAESGLHPRLKWPNDVLLSARKVAGILAESSPGPGGYAVVLGVGVNVNVPESDFPRDIRAGATSLLAETGRPWDRAELLVRILGHFGPLYVSGGSRRLDAILEHYRPLCETLGRRVSVVTASGGREGFAVDLDPTGGLVLDTGEVLHSGEVVHLL